MLVPNRKFGPLPETLVVIKGVITALLLYDFKRARASNGRQIRVPWTTCGEQRRTGPPRITGERA